MIDVRRYDAEEQLGVDKYVVMPQGGISPAAPTSLALSLPSPSLNPKIPKRQN